MIQYTNTYYYIHKPGKKKPIITITIDSKISTIRRTIKLNIYIQ